MHLSDAPLEARQGLDSSSHLFWRVSLFLERHQSNVLMGVIFMHKYPSQWRVTLKRSSSSGGHEAEVGVGGVLITKFIVFIIIIMLQFQSEL